VLVGGRPDDGDGLAETGFPLLDAVTALAAVGGIAMALRRWRRPASATLLAALLVLPLGALLTVEGGLYRRTYGLAPVSAILAALPLARLWGHAAARGAGPRRAAGIALAAVLGVSAARNAIAYFGPLQASEQMRYVFPYQVDAAARFVAALPASSAVFWYSDRWPARYETRHWFAPGAAVVERSPAFGAAVGDDGAPLLLADSDRESVFVLLGAHMELADEIRRRHHRPRSAPRRRAALPRRARASPRVESREEWTTDGTDFTDEVDVIRGIRVIRGSSLVLCTVVESGWLPLRRRPRYCRLMLPRADARDPLRRR
jgi:hypothetical protein